MRARDLLPQLAKRRELPDMATVNGALFMILFGLFQKTVLADNFGAIVESIQRMITNQQGVLPAGFGSTTASFRIYL
jgi:alginate O-acetyltransferase complex protein AlgI